MKGRSELPVYAKSAERLQDFISEPQGPARFRNGTIFVGSTRRNRKAVFIPFQFNDIQSYLIEATDGFFRFYKTVDDAGGIILETAKNITGVTNANPGVITSAAHGYSNGNEVILSGIVGVSGLNGKRFLVANVTANTFTLTDDLGNAISTIGAGVYVSGGTAEKIYEVVTPYAEADLETLQYTQNADTMYIVHQLYAPRKLTRTTETNWTLATYVRTADPFTGAGKWPRAAAFSDDARLLMGGTVDNPETIYGSRGPTGAGALRYDDFTTGTNASDAVIFTLAPIRGKVDSIQWLNNTDKFIVAGTFGTVRRIYGASEAEPITASSVTAKSVSIYGAFPSLPVVNGTTTFYVERGGRKLRSLEYDYQVDGYVPTDRNLVADHIARGGMKQIVNQLGSPEIIWSVTNRGKLLGLTYKDKEDISGWHRHGIAQGDVEWLGVMPRPTNYEQLWMIVKRTIDGQTVRYVEYFADPPDFPDPVDFFTGTANKRADNVRYLNTLYEAQKQAIHLDAASVYDGSVYGLDADASLTVGLGADELDATGVVFTASAAVFDASMVGRELWGKFDDEGYGGGRATITGFTDSTHVTATIVEAFPEGEVYAAGSWFLTATSVSGLDYLEGMEVGVVKDGADAGTETVTNGTISLDDPGSVIHVGLRYTGILKSLPLDQGGVSGPAQSKPKNVAKTAIRFLNSGGAAFGTDLYNLSEFIFDTGDTTGRPVPLFTGVKEQFYQDAWDENKYLVIVQSSPTPCVIQGLDIFMETTDE
jgi:hypothetical protein